MDGILNGYTSSVDLLKMVTEAYENDMAVFESAISADYVELFTEAVILKEDAEEASKEAAKDKQKENKENVIKGLWNVIVTALTNFKNKISGIIESITAKISQLIGKTAKDVEAHKAEFTAKAGKADGIGSFKYTDTKFIGAESERNKVQNKILDDVEIEKAMKAGTEASKFVENALSIVSGGSEVEVKASDVATIISTLTNDDVVKNLNSTKKTISDWCDGEIKKAKAAKTKENSEFVNYKVKVINQYQAQCSKMIHENIANWKKRYMGCYRIYKQVMKTSDNKETTAANASYIFELDEAAFIENVEAI